MKRILILALSLLTASILLSSGVAVNAAGGDLDPTFNPDIDTGGVNAIIVQPDGKILIGGFFHAVGNLPRNGIARLNPDGTLDPTFERGERDVLGIQSIALQPDGKIIIAGSFIAPYISTTLYSHIARLNSDGSFDTTFRPSGIEVYGIQAIALQPDGKIIVAGNFQNITHTAGYGVMRLNPDGSLDTSFSPSSLSPDNGVRQVIIQPDGKILACGYFRYLNGSPRGAIARFNSDGSLDTSFDSVVGADIHPTPPITEGSVLAMALQPDGKITITGRFTDYNGIRRFGVARLNSDGTLDPTLDTRGHERGVPLNFATAVQPDGKIIIAGRIYTYEDVARNNLVRL